MGVNREIADPFKRGFTSVPLPSAGLLDLAFFKALNEVRDGGKKSCVLKKKMKQSYTPKFHIENLLVLFRTIFKGHF